MKKRVFLLLLAVLLTFSLIGACGDNGKDPDDSSKDTTSSEPPVTTERPPYLDDDNNPYKFVFANASEDEFPTTADSALKQELMDYYDEISVKLGIDFSVVSADEATALATYGLSNSKIADVVKVRQQGWVPAAVNGYIIDLNTSAVLATGLDVKSNTVVDTTFTGLANIGTDSIWGCAFSGKYFVQSIGFTYVANLELLAQYDWTEAKLYEKVYNNEWTWDLFKEIASTISADGYQGQTMVDIESELESNGIGLMYYNETTKQWTSGFNSQNMIEALDFVLTIAQDGRYSMQGDVDNTTRRKTFYDGNAAFGCLYGGHFGTGGANEMADFTYGILPIPKGPRASTYSYVIPDLKVFTVQKASCNKDWEKSCSIMAILGAKFTDAAAADEFIAHTYLRNHAPSLTTLKEHLYPVVSIQATRFSPEIKETLDSATYYIMTLGPTAGAEMVHNLMQQAIDNLFGYSK